MTLWEDANERHPQLRDTFRDLEGATQEYQQAFIPPEEYADFFPFDVRARYIDMARDPLTAPGGVYGYGLWFGAGPSPLPTVFVQPGLAPPGGAPIYATPFASSGLGRQFSWPRRTLAMALPPPQLNTTGAQAPQVAAPNARVVVGSQRATLGLPIGTDDCPRAFTTAGHAAPITPARVRGSAGEMIGAITRAVNLDSAPPNQPTADIALVELAPDCPEQVGPLGAALDAAREIDKVSILGAGGGPASWVRGLSPSFALRPGIASWGEVAITADAISLPGDSGSLVVRDDGAVLGQIVAGHQGVYSLIQDIEYCLQELDAHVR